MRPEPSDRAIQLGSVTANKHLGQFRTQCSFSHFAYDDPLVAPGQPGARRIQIFATDIDQDARVFVSRDGSHPSIASPCGASQGFECPHCRG